MTQNISNLLLRVSPALLGAAAVLGFSGNANAQVLSVNDLESYEAPASLDQVTSVSQLSDVQPTDWAFQALQSLVERYGCIAGYPDGTFRGNQALTRYEFAAGLNACLDQILAQVGGDGIDPADLDTIRRLQDDFAAQLASLRGRVDSLEARLDTVEAQQFSTTTKLKGEVLFTIADTFGPAIGADDGDPTQTTFSDRVRLNFETSFTGRDKLRTRLEAGNINRFAQIGTDEVRLGHDANNGNTVEIDDLWYKGNLGDNTTFYVGTSGLDWNNVFDVVNPYFESSGSGALSRFGRRNPAVYRQEAGAGVSITHEFSDAFSISSAYLADDGASSSLEGSGLFNGDYAAGLQLDFTPNDDLHFALTYLHSYSGSPDVVGATGTALSQDPFGATTQTSGDHFGFQAFAQVNDGFALGGWAGLVLANNVDDNNGDQDSDIFTWALNLAFPDLGGDGNLAGLIVGQTPRVTNADNGAFEDDEATWHIEALYRIQLTKGIDITPGLIWLINPEAEDDNDDIVVVAVRTRFAF